MRIDYRVEDGLMLESGVLLEDVNIAYCTYGTLNENRDNVIWVCHALTAGAELHEWWGDLLGPGKLFDTNKYFVVCANNLGSPYGTTSPLSINPKTKQRYGLDFPAFTLRDTANLIECLIVKLRIRSIHLLIGGSCGGNIALEMTCSLKNVVQHLALLCSSANENPWTIAIHEAQRIALRADDTFYKNENKTALSGLKIARALAMPYYRSAESFNFKQRDEDYNKTIDFKASSYVNYQGEKFAKRFDAHCYYLLLKALDTHHIGRNRGGLQNGLAQISNKTVCVGIDTDLFIPIIEQNFLAEHLPNATYAEIKSIYGHDAFLIEYEQITQIVQSFLG